ncbi:MAG: hypothetical protein IKJ40_05010 [Bacteroidales bacterium]|nr:hypothetical protein [Bacteroidales bacterium]
MTRSGTLRHTGVQLITPTVLKINTVTLPSLPVVRYMYAICTVFVRFESVQIPYI